MSWPIATGRTPGFDAEAYWGPREYKIWVVRLASSQRANGKRKVLRDTKYVRAKTKKGAIRAAIRNSFLPGRIGGTARLATPGDLGCVPTTARQGGGMG